MAAQQGRALPKFGEWDVNNPESAEGFTVIFNKARNEKKTKNSPTTILPSPQSQPVNHHQTVYISANHHRKRKWFGCGC